MLYQIYETQRSFMEPFTDLAEVASRMFSNPQLPFAQLPLAQRISAGYDLLHRLGKDYEKPEFGIRTVDVNGVNLVARQNARTQLAEGDQVGVEIDPAVLHLFHRDGRALATA